MKSSLEIAVKYIKYYKNKSISILLSIIFAVALIVGIGTLYNSSKQANIENIRKETGDYHFMFAANNNQYNIIKSLPSISKIAATQYYDSVSKPAKMNLLQVDCNYVEMMNSKVLKGRMPQKENEFALEEWVMQELNLKNEIGEKISLKLVNSKQIKTFILSGILKDIPANKSNSKIEGFMAFRKYGDKCKLYIKFDEKLNIKKQIEFLNQKTLKNTTIYQNRDLLEAMNIYTYVPPLHSKGSIRYFINVYHLDIAGIILIIGLFSAFVIYNVFNISTLQRISEYGLLQALGADILTIFTILVLELLLLFLIGCPIGTIVGIFGAKLLMKEFSSVMLGHTIKSTQIIISLKVILIGTVFLLLLLILIAFKIMRKLNKITPIDAISKNFIQKSIDKGSRKLYTLRKGSITSVISFRYIVRRKAAFVGILLSLSLGGAIFICSDYAAQLTKENNELSAKVNNDLNSDYQINMQACNFDEGISNTQIKRIQAIDGVDTCSPISYYFGGIVINDEKMLSKILWDNNNKVPYFKNSFGGMYTKINDDSNNYLLRTGIYGYDNHMLNTLKDYILDGEINSPKMKQSNLILFKQIQDGGNGLYDMIDVKPGDTITIRYQKSPKISKKSLRFEEGPEYIEKDYVVAATLKRVAASNEYFIGDYGEDIIMTNEQFQRDFGVNTYNMVSVTKKKSTDHTVVAAQIVKTINSISNCTFRDLTIEIADNNAFLNKQLIFVYGVTLILFIISLFNILNNISYNVVSRINEFGILRAMGVTDDDFWKMIIKEGLLYSIFASIVTVLLSLAGQAAVFTMMKTGYLYINPHFTINIRNYLIIISLNIIIALIATILPSSRIVKSSIIEEIKRQE